MHRSRPRTSAPLAGVHPTTVRKAGPASLCSIYIRKIFATPEGNKEIGGATGFHYRDDGGRIWLVTNWHVLTGRRPDKPDVLLPALPRSPFRISVAYPGPEIGHFLPPVYLDLYHEGQPIWRQSKLEAGFDIAAILITPPEGAIVHCIQDFAERDDAALVPGLDVVIVGFPFEQGEDMPFPVWKRAMIAAEPRYTTFGVPQTLLDTPGAPGMSGSPVFRTSLGVSVTREQYDAFHAKDFGSSRALELMKSLEGVTRETVTLRWIGIYAGARSGEAIDRLSLGRMFFASAVDMATMHGEPGHNPFPPDDCQPEND